MHLVVSDKKNTAVSDSFPAAPLAPPISFVVFAGSIVGTAEVWRAILGGRVLQTETHTSSKAVVCD